LSKTTYSEKEVQETLQSLFFEKKKVKELQGKIREIGAERKLLKEQLEELSQPSLSPLSEVNNKLRKKIDSLEETIETSSSYSKNLEQRLGKEQASITTLHKQLKDYESSVEALKQEKLGLKNALNEDLSSDSTLKNDYLNTKEQLKNYEEKTHQLTASLKKAKQFIESQLSSSESPSKIQELKSLLRQLQTKYQELSKQKEQLETQQVNPKSNYIPLSRQAQEKLKSLTFKAKAPHEHLYKKNVINFQKEITVHLENAIEQNLSAQNLIKRKDIELSDYKKDLKSAQLNAENLKELQEKATKDLESFYLQKQTLKSLEEKSSLQEKTIQNLENLLAKEQIRIQDLEKQSLALPKQEEISNNFLEENKLLQENNSSLTQKHAELIQNIYEKEQEAIQMRQELARSNENLEEAISHRKSWEHLDNDNQQRNDLLEKEVLSLKQQLQRQAEENDKLQNSIKENFSSNQDQQVALLEEEVERQQVENSNLKQHQKEIESRLSNNSTSQSHLQQHFENKLRALEEVNADTENQNEKLCIKQERLEGIIEDREEQLEAKRKDCKDLNIKVSVLEDKLFSLKDARAQLEESHAILEHSSQSSTKIFEKNKKLLNQAQTDLTTTQSQNTLLQEQKQILEKQFQETEGLLQETASKLKKASEEASLLKKQCSTLKEQNEAFKKEVEFLNFHYQDTQKKLTQLTKDFEEIKNEEETFKVELQTANEGYLSLRDDYQSFSVSKHEIELLITDNYSILNAADGLVELSFNNSDPFEKQLHALFCAYQERCSQLEQQQQQLTVFLEETKNAFEKSQLTLEEKSKLVSNLEQSTNNLRKQVGEKKNDQHQLSFSYEQAQEQLQILEKEKERLKQDLSQSLNKEVKSEEKSNSLQELLHKSQIEIRKTQEQIEQLVQGIEQREQKLNQYKNISIAYEKLQEEHIDIANRFNQEKIISERLAIDLEASNQELSKQKEVNEKTTQALQKELQEKQKLIGDKEKFFALTEEKEKRLEQLQPLYEEVKEEKEQQQSLLEEQRILISNMEKELSFAKQALIKGVSEARSLEERYYEMVNEKISLLNKQHTLAASLKNSENTLYKLQEQYQTTKNDLINCEQQLKQQQSLFHNKNENYLSLEKEFKSVTQQQQLLSSQVKQNTNDIATHIKEKQELQNTLNTTKQEKSIVEQDNSSLKKQIEKIEKEIASNKATIENKDKEKQKLDNLVESLKKDNHTFSKNIKILQSDKKQLENVQQELKNQLKTASVKIQNQSKEQDETSNTLKDKLQENESFSKTVESKNEQIKSIINENQRQQRIIENLHAEISDKNSDFKLAQQHLAKKVKENTILQDFLEKKKIEALEVKNDFNRSYAKVEELENRLQLQKSHEEKLQSFVTTQIDEFKSEIKIWEEKHGSLQGKNNKLTQENQELLKIKSDFEQMQGLLGNLKLFMGGNVPIQNQGQQPNLQDSSSMIQQQITQSPPQFIQEEASIQSTTTPTFNAPLELFQEWEGPEKRPSTKTDSMF
jgi:chromosome segregation ATPase